jgi:hypothetical protein
VTALTPAADDANLRFDCKLPEFRAVPAWLWIRRVLVRAQEGQLQRSALVSWRGALSFFERGAVCGAVSRLRSLTEVKNDLPTVRAARSI